MADTGLIPVAEAGQYGQLAEEAAWGTPITTATIQLASIKLTDGPKIESEKFKASGGKLPSVVVFGQETGDIGFDGPATYEEVGYFIKSLAKVAETDIPSYSIQKGVPGVAGGRIYPGSVVTAWNLKGDPKGVNVSGNMSSKSSATCTPTPGLSQVAQTPIENSHVTVKIANSAIVDVGSWEINLSDLWSMAAYCGSNTPGGANEGDINGEFKMTLQASAANVARMDTRTEQTLELAFVSGAKNFNVKANVRFFNAEKFTAMGRVYAIGLTYQLVNAVVSAGANIVLVAGSG